MFLMGHLSDPLVMSLQQLWGSGIVSNTVDCDFIQELCHFSLEGAAINSLYLDHQTWSMFPHHLLHHLKAQSKLQLTKDEFISVNITHEQAA